MMINRPRVQWCPSRFHFAVARLFATVRYRLAREEPPRADREVYAIDRHQSAAENYLVPAWVFVTTTAYIAARLPLRFAWAAIPLAAAVLHIPLFSVSPVAMRFRRDHRGVISVAYFVPLLLASLYFAVAATAVRYVAWFSLAVFAANLLAAAILLVVREPECEA